MNCEEFKNKIKSIDDINQLPEIYWSHINSDKCKKCTALLTEKICEDPQAKKNMIDFVSDTKKLNIKK